MAFRIPSRWVRRCAVCTVLAVVVGSGWLFWPQICDRVVAAQTAVTPVPVPPPDGGPRVSLAADGQSVTVPQALIDSGRISVVAVTPAPPPEPLRLSGTIINDPNRHARIHTLFAGQVVKFGLPGDTSDTSAKLSDKPENGLRPGDVVTKGQILCVIHSKDAGAMKTDLLVQMSNERLTKTILDRYLSVEPGAIAKTQVDQARQNYEAAVLAVRNAERNLRASKFTEDEIAVVKAEGKKLLENKDAPRDVELERTWAEYAVRAPFDGVIVENNAHIGAVVDPTVDLFKVAKMDRLLVLANVYEEDLSKLQKLMDAAPAPASPGTLAGADRPDPQGWLITYQTGMEPAVGRFEKLGAVIDPMQHTGTVSGWVDNQKGKLFLGQFVTATVRLPADPALLAVPLEAVVEDADGTAVFAATDPDGRTFARRPVAVAVRGRDFIFLRKEPTPTEVARGAKRMSGTDRVIAHGAVNVAGEIDALQAEKAAKK